jgi:hypothetical protein
MSKPLRVPDSAAGAPVLPNYAFPGYGRNQCEEVASAAFITVRGGLDISCRVVRRILCRIHLLLSS